MPFNCVDCGIPGLFSASVRDDGLYDLTCPAGHRHIYCVPQHLYELLFEEGVQNAAQSNPRAAVGSWAVSLERFYEFFVGVIAVALDVTEQELERSWKGLASSSERQHGAFVASYLLAFREAPDVLSNRERQFRNDVVHKGLVPPGENAVAFGQRVLNLVSNAYNRLETSLPEPLRVSRLRHTQAIERRAPPTEAPVHWMPISTIYKVSAGMDRAEVVTFVQRARDRARWSDHRIVR